VAAVDAVRVLEVRPATKRSTLRALPASPVARAIFTYRKRSPTTALRRRTGAQRLGETGIIFMVHPTLSERDIRDCANAIAKVISAAAA